MLGNFSCLVVCWFFFKIDFSEKFFQEHYQSVKWFESRSGPTFCRSWFGSNLFAKIISRRRKLPLGNKVLTLVMLNILHTTLLPEFYPVNLQHSSCKNVFSIRIENNVDPDQMASSEAIWSGSTVFPSRDKSWFSRLRVKMMLDNSKTGSVAYSTMCPVILLIYSF